jgi:hypothetical protein
MVMQKPQIFVGSSGANLTVARVVADGLEERGCGDVTIWNEGVFGVNDEILRRLLNEVKKFDFAVMVWAGDDVTQSKGKFQSSPRDNVIFECGLFMGAIGRDNVFVVVDNNETKQVKRPSDFAGVVLAEYDSERFNRQPDQAVRKACNDIAEKMSKEPQPFQQFVGEWRSRYVKTAEIGHAEVIDDVDIESSGTGIVITSRPTSQVAAYSAHAQIHGNQIMGEWRHANTEGFAEGTFVLVVDPMARIMYGYCTGRNETGAMVFDTWVFVKKRGLNEAEVNERLYWGDKELRAHTQHPPLLTN